MTGEEDRVPAVGWFQLRMFRGEKRSQFRLSYPEDRACTFPRYCSRRELCPWRQVSLQANPRSPGSDLRRKFVL